MALTEKRKLFADEYLIDLNASRAYRVAYPRVKDGDTAAAAASRLLKIKDVSEYISVRMQERSERMFKDRMEVSGLEEEKSKLDDLINQMRGG